MLCLKIQCVHGDRQLLRFETVSGTHTIKRHLRNVIIFTLCCVRIIFKQPDPMYLNNS